MRIVVTRAEAQADPLVASLEALGHDVVRCPLIRIEPLGHEPIDPSELLPEAAQGALALQVRAGEEQLVAAADHAETRRRVEAERAAVAAVGGGCLAPVAAHHDGTTLTALIAAEDGSWVERRTGDDPVALGLELAALAR